MAIYRLMQNAGFNPEQIELMASAYEGALIDLKMKDREDPLTELIAKKVIEYAQRGERDPTRLREHVVREFNQRQHEAGSVSVASNAQRSTPQ
jgi:hypothetical protein